MREKREYDMIVYWLYDHMDKMTGLLETGG